MKKAFAYQKFKWKSKARKMICTDYMSYFMGNGKK